MKILSLGLDNSALVKDSVLANRIRDYGSLVDLYTVVVPSRDDGKLDISSNVSVFGVQGNLKVTTLLKIYKIAKKLCKDSRYTVITIQDQYYLALVGLILAKKFNIGLEIQVHGWEKQNWLRNKISRFVLKRANAVRTVSKRSKSNLIDEYGIVGGKITVVPIFSDVKLHSNDQKVKNSDKFIFLTVGRLVPVKNIELQIEAMSEILKEKQNIELWVVGDGPERDSLKKKIVDLKLENNIKLLGHKDKNELEKFYSQADCLLLTSDSEGWGMVVVEAASFALPIIMTDVGLAGEVIKDGESGVIIPVGERPALLNAMKKMIEGSQLRKNLGAMARKTALSLPSKSEILKLYKQSWEKARI